MPQHRVSPAVLGRGEARLLRTVHSASEDRLARARSRRQSQVPDDGRRPPWSASRVTRYGQRLRGAYPTRYLASITSSRVGAAETRAELDLSGRCQSEKTTVDHRFRPQA